MDRNWPDKINENPDSADEASTADAISNAAQAWSFLSFEDGGSGEDLLPPSSLNTTSQNLTEINTDNKIILPSSPEPQINSIHENLSSGNPSQNKQEIQTSAPPENARIEFQTNRSNETEKEVIIEFDNVTKVFRNQVVLRNLSFKIHKGETVCLIGESGCGKTVNLKLMIGLMKADKGTVRFHGRDLARMNEKQITATRIKFGFLFQMAALFDSMTIYDNVAFGLREHRLMPESAMPGYIKERLLEVGLPPGVELKKPAELSGGQRKRVGLARALALRPEVMLYDEPTTGLDPIMTDIINELIIQTQGHDDRAGIIVTHEMRTVTKCADRVIMLYPLSRLEPDEDQILYDGPPEGLEHHHDPRVRQFVLGEAGDRLREMSVARLADDLEHGVVPADPDEFVSGRKQ